MKKNDYDDFVKSIEYKQKLIDDLDDIVIGLENSSFTSNELENIDSFWVAFSNLLLNNGFSITNNPFVNMDYLHKRYEKHNDVFCLHIALDSTSAITINIEIMLNKDYDIVCQGVQELNGVLQYDKCKRFNIMQNGLLSENEIHNTIDFISLMILGIADMQHKVANKTIDLMKYKLKQEKDNIINNVKE